MKIIPNKIFALLKVLNHFKFYHCITYLEALLILSGRGGVSFCLSIPRGGGGGGGLENFRMSSRGGSRHFNPLPRGGDFIFVTLLKMPKGAQWQE